MLLNTSPMEKRRIDSAPSAWPTYLAKDSPAGQATSQTAAWAATSRPMIAGPISRAVISRRGAETADSRSVLVDNPNLLRW